MPEEVCPWAQLAMEVIIMPKVLARDVDPPS